MRDLDECKAEVFRRSEHRIKERAKKQKRFFACLTSCCVCCIVLCAVYLPMLMSAHNKNAPTGDKLDETTGISENHYRTSVTIKIQDTDNAPLYDSEDVNQTEAAQLFTIIQDIFEADKERKKGTDSCEKDSETYFGDPMPNDRLHTSTIKTITFTAPDGTKTTYTLDGNKLIDETTKQEIMLNEEQCAELLKRLALLINHEENEK